MINIIIFSKDRACQLDYLVRSIKEYFIGYENYTFNVLYKTSSETFEKGYKVLKESCPENFRFIKECEFKSDLIPLINPFRPYTMFFVDDNVMKGSFDPQFLRGLVDFPQAACLSLRMNPGITYCYTMDIKTPPPRSLEEAHD